MTHRVAIVGAGPSGFYAADGLLRGRPDLRIDVIDRLPTPFGLVRAGVAPDHQGTKAVVRQFDRLLAQPDLRFAGNIEIGRDLTWDEVIQSYDAVIVATGMVVDRRLGIPGEDLPHVWGSWRFVAWLNGHPDFRTGPDLSGVKSVAVVGNGNVALDVARMLVKHPEDLLPTEVPDNVYQGLLASPVTDVHVFGRRGPMQVKFTPLELRELGELRDVDMIVHEEDFDYDEASRRAIESNKQITVIDRIFTQWRQRETGQASRRLHLHFYAKPLEVVKDADGRVAAFRYERTEPDGQGGVRGTGEIREVAVQALYRAVGYFGSPLDGIPFDDRHGVIPNHEGQVLADDNSVMPGVYATGWIKRGPVGLIGHTKSDAMETIQHLVTDQASWWSPAEPDEQAVVDLLQSRGVLWTDLEGWHRLDAHEVALGAPQGRERIKVVPRDEMIRISRD